MKAPNSQWLQGFTLLEILVALAVLAIAMSALIKTSSQHLDNSAYLRDKTVAHWIAMNRMAMLQMQDAWPSPGSDEGRETMLEREWLWQVNISNTADAAIRRVTIEVRLTEDEVNPVTTLTGFLGRS